MPFRGYAPGEQEPLTGRADWVDAFIPDLEIPASRPAPGAFESRY
jgi:hypothetical protein